jgi:hypothetical protein
MALAADYLERAAGLSARPAAVHLQQQIQVKILDHAAQAPSALNYFLDVYPKYLICRIKTQSQPHICISVKGSGLCREAPP